MLRRARITVLQAWALLLLVQGLAFQVGPPVPVLGLVYTADSQGFLDPCGCAANQLGGLGQRARIVQQLREGTPNLILLDGGNLSESPKKLPFFAEAYALMGYQAVGIGPKDVTLEGGAAGFAQEFADRGVPVVSYDLGETIPAVSRFVIIPAGDLRIGITALNHQEHQDAKRDLERAKAAVQELALRADVCVLMSHLGLEANRQLAQEMRDFEKPLIILGDESHSTMTEAEHVGNVLLPPIRTKGTHLTVVDIGLDGQHRPVFLKAKLLPIPADLPPRPEVQAVVEKYYAGEQLEVGERAKGQAKADRLAMPLVEEPYALATHCGKCHPEQLANWRSQAHAQAIETLRKKNRLVAECLGCHSEEYRRTGYFDPDNVVADDGVTCATCHGEGRIHSLTGKKEFVERKIPEGHCRTCHTEAQQIHDFDYTGELETIRH